MLAAGRLQAVGPRRPGSIADRPLGALLPRLRRRQPHDGPRGPRPAVAPLVLQPYPFAGPGVRPGEGLGERLDDALGYGPGERPVRQGRLPVRAQAPDFGGVFLLPLDLAVPGFVLPVFPVVVLAVVVFRAVPADLAAEAAPAEP